ncbi:hypothetical protein SAMN04515674_105300 [Pseudarcicella hirudinis]|uniref:Uncharacterized protein n=1 Tax=Pseudarcicella hirudinis TaxID=1079859 RepID=A0A1I5T020_9BACT|nr:hypothetical protein [Pseudarcicella hirudinis]SFP76308.1 hypothetical protein SAMN04515674_105300 [Pseudarcicella hirudinis]
MYIIIWKNRHINYFVEEDSRGFIEEYQTYEEAKAYAEGVINESGSNYPDFSSYQIYEEANSSKME